MRYQFHATPHLIALLCFFAFYFILLQDVRHWSRRDPGSVFFDPKVAFERGYSLQREQEAEAWIDNIHAPYTKAAPDASLCIGIPTVQRGGARYFRRTVGSVLAGLTGPERRDVYLVSFFANVDPEVHVAYDESWTELVSDEILTYRDAEPEVMGRVRELEIGDLEFDRKPLFDYVHLLHHCYDKGMPYVVMLEDDVIAAEGWYYRTMPALKTLEKKGQIGQTVYLRLFYNERILGWNSEQGFSYLVRCLVIEAFVLGALLAMPRLLPSTAAALTPPTIITITSIITPLCILLYFLAGRLTVLPLPKGLNKMDAYGCCSQAFAIPRERIPPLIAYYESLGQGKIDVLTEQYANEQGLSRWALTPSVFAHVGSTSSKSSFVSQWGRSNTENIWNFGFEMFDAEALKDEHFG